MGILISLTDLLDSQTVDSIVSTLTDVVVALGVPADKWRAGGVNSSLRRAWATLGSKFTQWQAAAIGSGFIDWSSGGWLTLVAYYVFNVTRNPATFAAGTLTLTNTGGGIYTYGIGEVITFVTGSPGLTYTNAEAFTLNSMSTLPVAFQATAVGTASSAAPGTITSLETPLAGVTVTNAASFEGADQELDPDLRVRCRQKQATVSPNGPTDAYSYLAKSAATSTPITRTQVVTDPLTGIVSLYIANANGTSSDADIAIVQAVINKACVPLCMRCVVLGAIPVVIPVTGKAWIANTALTALQAQTQIGVSLAAFFAQLPIGGGIIPPDTTGKVRVNAIEGQIFQAFLGAEGLTAIVVDNAVDAPASDLVLATGQVPQLGAVNMAVTLL